MEHKTLLPVELYDAGYRTQVSVIPPNAMLSPNSKIQPNQRGKVPGQLRANGTWSGFSGWQKSAVSRDNVKQWAQDGANIGIIANRFPGLDIDITEKWLAEEVERLALEHFGFAPVRVGRFPKRLLMYRTREPFSRIACRIDVGHGKSNHLVEMLCEGRQYLIHGQHPDGPQYKWSQPLQELDPQTQLTFITVEAVRVFFQRLQEHLEQLPGVTVNLIGDGQVRDRSNVRQDSLVAPDMSMLADAVARVPNDDIGFPDREDYIKFGIAVKAASGTDTEGGFVIWSDWAGRHVADGRVEGNPETWRTDWDRMHPPYSVGWPWVAEIAGKYGFNLAQNLFVADLTPAPSEVREEERPPEYSDRWLAGEAIRDYGSHIRYVATSRQYYVWTDGRWAPDATLRAEYLIGLSLQRRAATLEQRGATTAEQRKNSAQAKRLCSTSTLRSVMAAFRSDPRIAAEVASFDTDPWILNTPGGMVDLMTGEVSPHDPDAMCSAQTLVAPDWEMSIPVWTKFLHEATGGDLDLQRYLKRASGYALTGITQEQVLLFLYGSGGNGKGTFLNTLLKILRSYALQAPMESFTGYRNRHPADLAAMCGKRLVIASETREGKKWDEARIKTLTGGDQVSARFMGENFFEYTPQFKLMFSGNHRPEISSTDEAMRRRIHLVPFDKTPPVIDLQLDEKIRLELPGILAWAVDGAVEWGNDRLDPPASVRAATETYFEDEDVFGMFLAECTEQSPQGKTSSKDLYARYREWANDNGHSVVSAKAFSQDMVRQGYRRCRITGNVRGFMGLTLTEEELP